jgi:hypothetical protein
VDGQQGPRALADTCGDQVGVDGEVVLADVGEAHGGARLEGRVEGGGEGERRGHHLVAGPEVQHLQRRHERRRPVADGHGVADAHDGGERLLEALHHRALGEDAGSDDLEHEGFGITDVDHADGDHEDL